MCREVKNAVFDGYPNNLGDGEPVPGVLTLPKSTIDLIGGGRSMVEVIRWGATYLTDNAWRIFSKCPEQID